MPSYFVFHKYMSYMNYRLYEVRGVQKIQSSMLNGFCIYG